MRSYKVMRSRLSGKLQAYVLTEQLTTCERFDFDMSTFKVMLQSELDANEIDAQVDSCKKVRAYNYDYIITNIWCPASSPIPATIVVAIAKAIITVATYAAIVAITYYAAVGFKELLYPTPKYYCSICGAGPFSSLSELIAHRIKEHPEAAKYQCPYCGQAFETIEQLNAHMAECPWKPKEVPAWLPWLVIGIVAVGAIIIVPRVLELIPKKR